ncbi:MAG: hypothetical protein M3N04_05785 [Actinomycetota bacterium]|nr:hypothetical protein [Actinomycetota bacterium]
MSTEVMIVLSMLAAVLLVVILATALTMVGKRLEVISDGLGKLGSILANVESQHLRPLDKLVADVNGPLKIIVDTLPVIAGKARLVVRKAQGG